MRHINYNHLFYFWNVANEGSIAGASRKLFLTPQTISAQIKLLEEVSESPLFEKSGRTLTLTAYGETVKGFADEIFSLGGELTRFLRGHESSSPTRLNVGVVETVPKMAVELFLEPAFDGEFSLWCQEGDIESLVAELMAHKLDIVISDISIAADGGVRGFTHLLGTSALALYAPESLFMNYSAGLPDSLNGAPVLLPLSNSPLRRAAEDWFLKLGVAPNVVAECSDIALITAMAAAGRGLFVAPINIRKDIERATGCVVLTEMDGFEEKYYAITAERKIEHPAVAAIAENARVSLIGTRQ